MMSNIKALLVGVCEYPVLGLQELPLCKNDVLALKHALILGLNAKESNINICGTNGIVSSKDLIEELTNISFNTNAEETLIFYFSGHGGNNAIALSDGLLSVQSLISVIDKIKSKNKIIILDSCHSGDFTITDSIPLDLSRNIDSFVGRGYAVLASCGADQSSGFNENFQISCYTKFLYDALMSRFLIKNGRKSLEDINHAISHFAKRWNVENPTQKQTPIFRSNVGGTIFFDVEEYKPYRSARVYDETDAYIIYAVEPVHTALAKRFAVKVILRYESSFEEIAEIANEVKEKIKYANVYPNAISEAHHKGKTANIIWCYFGYSEDDIVDSNYVCYTTWIDNTQDKANWYRKSSNSQWVNGVYMAKNSSYKALYHALHGEEVCKDDLIVKTRKITEELVDSAQRFIKLYREYRNDVLSEEELINSVEFLNKKITHLFFLQSDLPYPPKELHDWSNAHTLIAGTIHDFSLYYDKKNLKIWTTENRIALMDSAIARYENDLENLKALEKSI